MKRIIHNNRGETLVEGVCSMVVFLIAVFIFIGAAGYALTLLKAAGEKDKRHYTEFGAEDSSLITTRIDIGGSSYTYDARLLVNSAGFVYLEAEAE